MQPEGHRQLSDLAARAQAFLFVEGGSLPTHKLAQLLKSDQRGIKGVLEEIAASLEGSGLTLIQTDKEVSLATAPRVSDAVRESFEEALERDIGEAGLEVLAIVLYRGPSTRTHIDYIRGVNTTSTIRTLLARGLLERASDPTDARQYVYRPTPELLAHLGVRASAALPEYDTIRAELAAFEASHATFADHDADAGDVEHA